MGDQKSSILGGFCHFFGRLSRFMIAFIALVFACAFFISETAHADENASEISISVGQVLSVHLDSDDLQFDIAPTVEGTFVKKTVSVVAAELEQKGIALNLHLAVSLPKVLADCTLIQQSILNLINNAMQAMPEDRKDPTITVSTFMEDDMVKICVADNGCGMTEEQMSKIFEPYYTTKSSGTGLGLTVLFKIMKQHEGDVTVHSTPGKGSEFTLQIPVPSTERFRLADDGRNKG